LRTHKTKIVYGVCTLIIQDTPNPEVGYKIREITIKLQAIALLFSNTEIGQNILKYRVREKIATTGTKIGEVESHQALLFDRILMIPFLLILAILLFICGIFAVFGSVSLPQIPY
jgi:hypothetical protein